MTTPSVIWQPATFDPEIADIFRGTLASCKIPHVEVANTGFQYTIDRVAEDYSANALHPFGTMEFVLYGIDHGWNVDFNADFDYLEAAQYGSKLLNWDFRLDFLGDIHISRPTFVRQGSAFNRIEGRVFQHQGEWDEFVTRTLPTIRTYLPYDSQTICILAAPKKILEEYRVFIVDNAQISSSMYFNEGVFICENADNNIKLKEFTRLAMERWKPGKTFVMDVARTPQGWFVVETNCVHCADFYDCDVEKIMNAYASTM